MYVSSLLLAQTNICLSNVKPFGPSKHAFTHYDVVRLQKNNRLMPLLESMSS